VARELILLGIAVLAAIGSFLLIMRKSGADCVP
jgi:hypothetical protein